MIPTGTRLSTSEALLTEVHGAVSSADHAAFNAIEDACWPGESMNDCAERVLLAVALSRTWGHQAGAARRIGLTPRVMNYRCRILGLRRKDVRSA